MASKQETLDFVLWQLSGIEGLSWRKMMGEYIIYLNAKVVGGIYDERFMLKNTARVRTLLPSCPIEAPYTGAKAMINASDIIFNSHGENKELFARLLNVIYQDIYCAR